MTAKSRRRAGGPSVTVIWWGPIPAQVSGRDADGVTFRVDLSPRFQQAIDALAMRQGRAGTDTYLDGWDRRTRVAEGDVAAAVAAEAAALERRFPPHVLSRLASGAPVNEETRAP